MNYQKIHDQIIERALSRSLDGYKESHHILPRSLGGSDDPTNLVDLTAREHYLVHWLLHRANPSNSKLAYAFWRMSTTKRTRVSSRAYQEAKLAFIEAHTGRDVSDETRQRLSEAALGRPGTASPEHVAKLVESGKATRFKKGQVSHTKGTKLSQETIEKRTKSRAGYKTSDETKAKISAKLMGMKRPFKKRNRVFEEFECSKCARIIKGQYNFNKHTLSCASKV